MHEILTFLELIDAPRIVELNVDPTIRINNNNFDYQLVTINDWLDKFSTGELQRFIIARILFQQPKYVILDETLSNLDLEWRRKILKRFCETKMSYLTVSHDSGLEEFHEEVIELENC